MEKYDFKTIEQKWQNIWTNEKRFEVNNENDGKESAYYLVEFPYPSGKGLHTGHVRSYSALDAMARRARLMGKKVLFPMGIDAFGLEAERTAIKEHILPQEVVKRNTAVFKDQLKMLGLSFDWNREISTCDPKYYKWTQWLFLQFVKHGLAEKQDTNVNFCPNCGVLANEEVEDGKCCQCHSEIVQKTKAQWILKMTKYAERLADDLKDTEFLEHIKTSQINWIGKSEGVQVKFNIKQGGSFEIFTTCIETIYGITFMVLAPENPVVDSLKDKILNWNEVEKYRKETAKKNEFERGELSKGKSGCLLEGIQAINPVNGKEVPIFIADFVLASYGTGAVMAVPSHDQRDYDLAKVFNIPMIEVVAGGNIADKAFEKSEYLNKDCKLVNSDEFTGERVEVAKKLITEKLVKMGVAHKQLNFKMRDWVFSRQRYWGEPIPMIYCEKCGWVPVPEVQLPVMLPNVKNYETTKDGESPLSQIPEFVNTTCPCCGGKAKRETDTMPGWAGSSWYFMRYCDPQNDKEFVSKEALKKWLPVDLYNGGNEHTTRHLLYARFWSKFFYDIGISPVNEPFKKRISQGMVLGANGVKMSKSLGNVVDPRDVVKEYGADSLRVWEAFMGDYSEMVNWSDEGVKACFKFLNRVWNLQANINERNGYTKELLYPINFAIKKFNVDMDNIKFNTAISCLMTLVNEMYKSISITEQDYQVLLILLNPFAPHITSELYEKVFKQDILDATWPVCDESALIQTEIEIPVQINGKLRGVVVANKDSKQEEILNLAKQNAEINKYFNAEIKKVIYVPGRIFNIIV